jgi:hypothetical protein
VYPSISFVSNIPPASGDICKIEVLHRLDRP